MSAVTYALPHAGNIARATFDNGVTVWVYENFAAQSVVLTGSLRAGAAYDTPDKSGLASLTAAALMRGARKRDFMGIHSALEDIGADINVSAGGHRASFTGKSLAEDLPTLIDVLADVLRHPTFPSAHVERLRGEILTGLSIRNQDTRYRASRLFSETLYPAEHPYHYSLRGTIESVKALTLDDIAAFHAAHYGADALHLVIVGAVKADDAIQIIRDALADWHNPNQPAHPAIPTVPSRSESARVDTALAGKTQSDIVMGTIGPARSASDYHAATLANSVLGQFGMMGRVGASVREDLGLAYYAYSALDGGLAPGPWSISAGVNPKNVDLAVGRIIDEVRRLVDTPVTPDELADNQSYYVGRLPLQLESNEGIAASLHNMLVYDLGLDYLPRYRDTIMALTTADLQAAARHYFNPEGLVIAVAGPAETE
jgi:zinc protease